MSVHGGNAEPAAQLTHHPVGPEARFERALNNFIKNKSEITKGNYREYKNRGGGPYQMPPQRFQMLKE